MVQKDFELWIVGSPFVLPAVPEEGNSGGWQAGESTGRD
jgi:hypothetical protein